MTNGQGTQPAPTKIVILGGGPAGVAAAFWLTAPEQQDRYQVTLYAQGWRLGGKCASGRAAEHHDRIEEHGLHMLLGCYQNAFATIRTCYDEWQPPPTSPIQTWRDAFLPQRQFTLMETDGPGGSWAPWNFANLPQWPGEPGDQTVADLAAASSAPMVGPRGLILRLADWVENTVGVGKLVRKGGDAVDAIREAVASPTEDHFEQLARVKTANLQLQLALGSRRTKAILPAYAPRPLAMAQKTDRLLILANLGLAMAYGFLRDVFGRGEAGYDALNDQDFRAWLSSCYASDEALESAPIRAIYDLTFAFPGGDAESIANGSIAAGVTLRFAMEAAFGYRDAPVWKMAAAMGDTVFTPFYQVLQARKSMSIQFFSRVTNLLAGNSGGIAAIELSIQAQTADGGPYDPLVEVNGLACWPNQPDWSQLKDGNVIKGANFELSSCTISVGTLTLTAGKDFDIVILALPPAAIMHMQPSFVQGSSAWMTALNGSRSVATQSLQLWLEPTLSGLGWYLGPTVMTAFAEPYDSWGDMSQLLRRESWSGPNAPQTLGYFCGCMDVGSTPPTPNAMLQLAINCANQWMAQSLQTLWPQYQSSQIVDRYDLANYDFSDLYVQTPAGGNVASRFSSAEVAGFSNLYVVGDWTQTRFSGGCFESAIESAMLVSKTISGFPTQVKTS